MIFFLGTRSFHSISPIFFNEHGSDQFVLIFSTTAARCHLCAVGCGTMGYRTPGGEQGEREPLTAGSCNQQGRWQKEIQLSGERLGHYQQRLGQGCVCYSKT